MLKKKITFYTKFRITDFFNLLCNDKINHRNKYLSSITFCLRELLDIFNKDVEK